MWNFNTNKVDKEHLYRIAWGPQPKDECNAALWTGEIREPKKDEFYIDEKELIVYEAIQDMDVKKHIAKIVKVKQHEYYTIEGD